MKIYNAIEIFDNGEFITITTLTGSNIHLPMNAKHSITLETDEEGVNTNVILSYNEGDFTPNE